MDFKELTNRGLEHAAERRFAEAEADYREALRLSDHPFIRLNLGNLLFDLSRYDEAEVLLREALARMPGDYRPARSLGMTLVALGRPGEGWPLYDQRREGLPLPFPEWRGEPLKGRRLIVRGEQGLGDEIMLSRYIPTLIEMGADVSVACLEPLFPLLRGLGVNLIPRGNATAFPPADHAVRMFSLPRYFGTVAPLPLAVKPRKAQARIGVKWNGAPGNPHDRWRSLPEDLGNRLLDLPGAISLAPEDTGARDFRDTAEIIAALELVITVDTSVAHLAGSLGVPTWILLPAIHTDFRWGRSGNVTPWYPSMRLFRQPEPENWASVVDEVARLVLDEDHEAKAGAALCRADIAVAAAGRRPASATRRT